MIFWIASYPKSGNTWLRALVSTYYYSNNGYFDQNLLKNIDQFPTRKYFEGFDFDKNKIGDTCKYWVNAQEKINTDKKLKFLKTHNIFGKVNNYDFTNSKNSIGCLYIVRDPRNVITSLKNHYDLDYEIALKWMKNEKQFVYDVDKVKTFGFSDFQFISSWSVNYKSWKKQNKIAIKFIRYEDLLEKTYLVFKDIIEFINKTTNNNQKIDIKKLKNTINQTSFNNLKRFEKNNGFFEAVHSSTKKKKISFFNLGPENDWKKLLDDHLINELSDTFKKDLIDLSYK